MTGLNELRGQQASGKCKTRDHSHPLDIGSAEYSPSEGERKGSGLSTPVY